MEEKKTVMVPVPIPTEIPEPPSLENLPLDILHSATVEMLIQQNEDLSSRLKVNIRRNSQLEQKIIELEKDQKQLQRVNENLKAQNDIVREKEQLWTEQKEEKSRQLEAMEKDVSLLNTRYNELYQTSEIKQKEQRQTLINTQRQLEKVELKNRVLNKVRFKAKDKLREFLLTTAQGLQSSHQQFRQSQSSQKVLQKSFAQLKNETIEKENFFKEQLQAFKKATEKSQEQLIAKKEELEFINSQLKEDKDSLKEELDQATTRFYEEKRNRSKLKHLSVELDSLKNESIQTRRELTSQLERSEEARQMEVDKTQKFLSENQELNKQILELKTTLEACETKMLSLNKDNKEVSSQLESLQELWIKAQDKLEKEEAKRQSLERINRELSRQNKDERLKRAIEHSTAPIQEPSQKEAVKTKISEVYASQFSPFGKGPEMDL